MIRKEIILIEVAIESQDQLKMVEDEKRRKYDVLVSEMSGSMHNCKTRIVPYIIDLKCKENLYAK